MSNNEKDNLQILAGALIVLSLALLYCWSKQKHSKNSYGPQYSNYDEGFVNRQVVPTHLTGLKFAEKNKQLSSMHDMETMMPRIPVLPHDAKNKLGATYMRWLVDGQIKSGDPADQQPATYAEHFVAQNAGVKQDNANDMPDDEDSSALRSVHAGVTVPSEVITPLNTGAVSDTVYNSVSSAVLSLTDYTSQFENKYAPMYSNIWGQGKMSV